MRKLLLILASGAILTAQQPGGDPLAAHFVPPEVIMQHQVELGVSEAQRERIKGLVIGAQQRFTELQWDLQAEVEALSRLLADHAADEEPVLEQLSRVLAIEGDVKRTQVSMLLALRRELTPEQFAEAQRLRPSQGAPQRPPGR